MKINSSNHRPLVSKNHTCAVLNLTPLYFLCLVRADYDCTAAVQGFRNYHSLFYATLPRGRTCMKAAKNQTVLDAALCKCVGDCSGWNNQGRYLAPSSADTGGTLA